MADREEDRKLNSPKKDSKSSKVSKESRKSRKHSSSPDSSESSRTSSSSSSPVRKKSRKSKSKKKSSKRSPSTEGSVSCDSNDSELEANKKKHKKLKRSQERKKDKKRKRKKDKSRKKEKKSTLVVNQQKYGKYGIFMESDMFNKQQEFYLWLQEVKQINPEVLPRFEMKKMFHSYAEDYNTVTLPHKKFYNLEKWEAKRQEKGRMKAMKKAQKQQVSIETDELRHKSLHSGPTKPGMSREDLLEMQRIMRERQQEDYKKKAGMKVDESKGVRYQAIPP